MRILDRKILLTVTLLVSVLALPFTWAQNKPADIIKLFPGDLTWSGNPSGLQTTLLAGNPDAAEVYAQRIKFPVNFKLLPHYHSDAVRMVTILSGTLYYAFGDKFDETKLTAFPAGSFFTEPKGMPHYAMSKEEVILQLNAIGPAGTIFVENKVDSKEKK